MNILVIYNGEYGLRHIQNIERHGPSTWHLERWQAPLWFPLVVDYPEEYLPEHVPPADLILSFAEHKSVAELLPDLARRSGAQAVIAPVDNENYLPRGLARQLRGWLEKINVACATPKPLCSLTEVDYGVTRRERIAYSNPLISEFARTFGQPKFNIQVNPETRAILSVEVLRDTVCGCGRFVAEGLLGVEADEAEEKAGMLHHHYPCLASMGKDSDFGDTLMHVSGNILRDEVREQVKAYKRVQPIVPGTRLTK